MSRLISSLAAATALGLVLSGCASLRPTQKAFAPDEYDARHPIKIQDDVRHIDIFANGAKLDHRQKSDLVEFGREYAAHGRSGMIASVPQGAGHTALSEIQAALAQGGARVGFQVRPYAANAQDGAAPIRLSYMRLTAKVDSKCGLWPEDVSGIEGAKSWHNRPTHNLGCAYQTMIAAQVADPLDLIRGRPEGPMDVGRRIKDIEAIRKGEDPSTKYAKDDVKVKEAASGG